jgi:hypothetical protein
LCVLFIFALSGCLSPITLNRAVMAYDEAVVNADAKQLLVNIARAQHHQPLHFTRVSAIAATFNFSANAGATPALTGDRGACWSRYLAVVFLKTLLSVLTQSQVKNLLDDSSLHSTSTN